jgi:hypothetical protein
MSNLVATVLGDRHSVDGLGPSSNLPGDPTVVTP